MVEVGIKEMAGLDSEDLRTVFVTVGHLRGVLKQVEWRVIRDEALTPRVFDSWIPCHKTHNLSPIDWWV